MNGCPTCGEVGGLHDLAGHAEARAGVRAHAIRRWIEVLESGGEPEYPHRHYGFANPEIYNQLREEWYGNEEGEAVGPAGSE